MVSAPASSSPLVSVDRVHAARAVADELGIDVVVVTPGSDLRYLSGYAAHAMERLTALAVPRRGPTGATSPATTRTRWSG